MCNGIRSSDSASGTVTTHYVCQCNNRTDCCILFVLLQCQYLVYCHFICRAVKRNAISKKRFLLSTTNDCFSFLCKSRINRKALNALNVFIFHKEGFFAVSMYFVGVCLCIAFACYFHCSGL